jgi:putative transposase
VAVAVDINENNVAFGSMERVRNIKTGERAVRTAYFLKRRRLQSRPRLNEKPLLAKYSVGRGGGLKTYTIRSLTR